MTAPLFVRLLLFVAFTLPAMAAKKGDVLFEADRLERNLSLGFVEATGNAQFQLGDTTLVADRVRYFEEEELLHAFGNITLTRDNKLFFFAQKLVLDKNGEKGNLENMALLFEDNSKLSARYAKRGQSPGGFGLRNQMRFATYSSCKVCKDKKNYPLWQISASKATHYEDSETIYYNNLFLEFFGVPVFYLPLFAHPSPSVERRSGLLTPSIGYSNRLGGTLKTPFTIDLAPQTSLVVTPLVTSKDGAQLSLAWSHWTQFGIYNIAASGAHSYTGDDFDRSAGDLNSYGAHVFSDGDFAFGKNHHLTYQAQWASDDDYLDFFDVSSLTYLESNVRYLWQGSAGSLSIESYNFKNLLGKRERENLKKFPEKLASPPTQDLTIRPLVELSLTPALFGGHAFVNINALVLISKNTPPNNTKQKTNNVERVSSTVGWQDEWSWGAHFFQFYTYGRYDFYRYDTFYEADTIIPNRKDERLLGLLQLEWSYPLMFYNETLTSILEPRVQLIYAPYKSQKPLPNTDSDDFYFSATNLFDSNRFPGLDRWESGPRANVGFRWSVFGSAAGSSYASQFTFGKILRRRKSRDFDTPNPLDKNKPVPDSSGAADKDSDFVMRWELNAPYITFAQSARLDRNHLAVKRYDVSGQFRFDRLSLGANYVFNSDIPKKRFNYLSLDKNYVFNSAIPKKRRESLYSSASFRFAEHWRVFGGMRYDLGKSDLLSYSSGIAYDDECFKMDLDFSQRLNQTNGADNNFKVGFRLTFVNLGSLRLSSGAEQYVY